eukprot:357286-Chlamydomonas_euryale.AAC.5
MCKYRQHHHEHRVTFFLAFALQVLMQLPELLPQLLDALSASSEAVVTAVLQLLAAVAACDSSQVGGAWKEGARAGKVWTRLCGQRHGGA